VRPFLPDYELVAPRTLDEVLGLLAREPGVWRPIAGGTDLMVLFAAGALPFRKLVSIQGIPELSGIRVSAAALTIGALTTFAEIRRHPLLEREFPSLSRAASWTGAAAIQNRATLGGNLVNASPAADSPPALLVYDAELEAVSASGARSIPYRDFHTGYKQTALRPGELLAAIRLPRHARDCRHYIRKVGARAVQAIAKVSLAARARLEDGAAADVRIACGSVAAIPLRCLQTEAAIEGRQVTPQVIQAAQAALAGEISPVDDLRSTARYRRRVALNLLAEFLECLGRPAAPEYRA